MSIQKVSVLVFVLIVTGCGRLTEPTDTTLDSGPNNTTLSVAQYADFMHRDLTGQPAPASFTRGFVQAYQSGQNIQTIVTNAVKATPSLQSAATSLYSSTKAEPTTGRGIKGDSGRGFSARDLLLIYLAYKNNDTTTYTYPTTNYSYPTTPYYYGGYDYSSTSRSYYDSVLPYTLTSRQYYYYLLYSYLLN